MRGYISAALGITVAAVLVSTSPAVTQGTGASGKTPAPTEARVVIASLEVDRLESSGKILSRLLSVATYQDGQYRDARVSGADPDDVRRLAHRSILNSVKQFSIYLRGEKVGDMHIDRVDAAEFCSDSALAGFGTITWSKSPDFASASPVKLPTGETIRSLRFDATSPALRAPESFLRDRILTAKQRESLIAVAKSALKEATSRRWEGVSRVIPHGEVELKIIDVIDVTRDGTPEFVAVFDAPLREPKADYPGVRSPWMRMLLVVSLPASGGASILLHLPTLIGLDEQSQSYTFLSALDPGDNGVADILLLHEYYESARYEVFALRQSRFNRVFAGEIWGC